MMEKKETLRNILGKNIRARRTELGLSQATLAEKADVSNLHINEIERGLSWVSSSTLENISDALKIETYKLLIPTAKPTPPEKMSKAQLKESAVNVIDSTKEEIYGKVSAVLDEAVKQIADIFEDKGENSRRNF